MNNITALQALNDDQLLRVFGGEEYLSSEHRLSNAINYYINLIPTVSRNHVRVTYNPGEWTTEEGKKAVFKRNITQTVEESDMQWSALSGSEKVYVAMPVAFGAFVSGCIALRAIARPTNKHS